MYFQKMTAINGNPGPAERRRNGGGKAEARPVVQLGCAGKEDTVVSSVAISQCVSAFLLLLFTETGTRYALKT